MTGFGFGHGFGAGSRKGPRGASPPPAPPSVLYGRTAGYDAGTDGDLFVDGVAGLNTNNGLTPATAVKTISRAFAMVKPMTGARTIRVMGDGLRYREFVDASLISFPPTTLSSLRIASYGTDQPWISGANVVAGFVPCTAADEALLGPVWSNVHKATVAKASIAHTAYWRMMLSENGAPLTLACLRDNADFPAFFTDATRVMFRTSEHPTLSFGLSGQYFDTITHAAVLPAFTDAQLAQTIASVHAFPNFGRMIPVASAAGGVLQLAATTLRPEAVPGYALHNLLPSMTQGGWGYRDNGDGTLTLYVWPNDPAHLTGGIEIAVRKSGMKVTKGTQPFTLEGIGLEMSAVGDNDFADGLLFFNDGDNVTVRQIELDRFSSNQSHMLYFKFNENVTLEHATVRRGQASFGVGNADTAGQGVYNMRYRNLLAEDCSHTGFRIFGMRDSVLSDLRAVRTGAGGHANLFNLYLGCDRVAVVNFNGAVNPEQRPFAGYATVQNCSRLLFLHCTFTMASDGRAFVDQTAANAVLPDAAGDHWLINCWAPQEPSTANGNGAGIIVGKTVPVMNWRVFNCVAGGIAATGAVSRKANLLLATSAIATDASEVVAAHTTVHVDAANADWRAKQGGPLDPMIAGHDVGGVIAQWEAWFPDADFRRDCLGRTWSPADPGVGPYGKAWAY